MGLFSFFTIISPRWGFFSFGLGLLQMFHPDGVGFRSVFRLLQLFHPDGVGSFSIRLTILFHQQSLMLL
jgi:hypothetical protein